MARVNLNTVAKLVAKEEGGAVSTNIAQIKEVIRCYNKMLRRHYKLSSILELFERSGV